jgi:hypothetical protein
VGSARIRNRAEACRIRIFHEFRDRLIAEVRASDKIRARDGTSDHGEYYDHFLHALEKLLDDKKIA